MKKTTILHRDYKGGIYWDYVGVAGLGCRV